MSDRLVLPPPPSGDLKRSFVSRAGLKLDAALTLFAIDVVGTPCADLGANVGGFTDCLLQHGAAKVFSVDTAYGVLAWILRKDPRVVVMERHNALHLRLPEKVGLAALDVGWTRQQKILPVAATLLAEGGDVLTLIKPHYESDAARIQRGVLSQAQSEEVLWRVMEGIDPGTWRIGGVMRSPIEGQKGNVEYVAWLSRPT